MLPRKHRFWTLDVGIEDPGGMSKVQSPRSKVAFLYSSTKMFFFAHISFKIFGQTVTLTSPK